MLHWGFLILAFIAGFVSCYIIYLAKEDVAGKLAEKITQDITSPPWHG